MYFSHPISPSPFLGESNVEELKWMEIFQDNIEVNWLAMHDVAASTEPAYTTPINTALLVAKPIGIALLAAKPVGVALLLPSRSNRGKLPDRYSPKPATKVKYPIANYMSTPRLSEACEVSASHSLSEPQTGRIQGTAVSLIRWQVSVTQSKPEPQSWQISVTPSQSEPQILALTVQASRNL
ncbi:hypothetical protein L3X38_024072 [Prunus dulcis]|uniref:Uncharacterized protein n=1 Tax=Prunus dulcis TaxID=3755 RepID=A0AAD4Z5T6_PRUDU|nr:hypothetical protein L3X38_024072 [Prunus dulcis]